jgi:hypothetical protein
VRGQSIEERLASPDLATRVAARLDLIDDNLARSERLGLRFEELRDSLGETGRRHWRRRARLRAAMRSVHEDRLDLLDQNDRIMIANACETAGWRR